MKESNKVKTVEKSRNKILRFLISHLHFIGDDIKEFLIASLPAHQGLYSNIKCFLLRTSGAQIGNTVYVYPGVRFYGIDGLIIGNNVVISSYTIINAVGIVTIGNNVLIGYGSKILSANHIVPKAHGMIWGSGHDCKPIVIGDEVWIGANVIVLAGVTIGRGAVVAAGAVVTHDVEPFSIMAGVPAKLLSYRD